MKKPETVAEAEQMLAVLWDDIMDHDEEALEYCRKFTETPYSVIKTKAGMKTLEKFMSLIGSEIIARRAVREACEE